MYIIKAKEIVMHYVDTVVENTKNAELAVLETKCKYSKSEIVTAFKVVVAHYTIFKYIDSDMNQNFFSMLNRLNILVEKDKYDQFKKLDKKIRNKGLFSKKPSPEEMREYTSFFQNAFMCKEHDEVVDIQSKVIDYWQEYLSSNKPIETDEPYKHIYNLIGLEYDEDCGVSFYEEGVKDMKLAKIL